MAIDSRIAETSFWRGVSDGTGGTIQDKRGGMLFLPFFCVQYCLLLSWKMLQFIMWVFYCIPIFLSFICMVGSPPAWQAVSLQITTPLNPGLCPR